MLCGTRQVPFSQNTQQWAGWKHRALSFVEQEGVQQMPKDRGAEPRDFAVPWNAVWLWGWYRLRHDCVLLCPNRSSERTMRDMLYKKTEDWQDF